jgi:hypothetical protein
MIASRPLIELKQSAHQKGVNSTAARIKKPSRRAILSQ